MPSLKSAAISAMVILVTLFLFVRFAPDSMRRSVGLNPPQ